MLGGGSPSLGWHQILGSALQSSCVGDKATSLTLFPLWEKVDFRPGIGSLNYIRQAGSQGSSFLFKGTHLEVVVSQSSSSSSTWTREAEQLRSIVTEPPFHC